MAAFNLRRKVSLSSLAFVLLELFIAEELRNLNNCLAPFRAATSKPGCSDLLLKGDWQIQDDIAGH